MTCPLGVVEARKPHTYSNMNPPKPFGITIRKLLLSAIIPFKEEFLWQDRSWFIHAEGLPWSEVKYEPETWLGKGHGSLILNQTDAWLIWKSIDHTMARSYVSSAASAVHNSFQRKKKLFRIRSILVQNVIWVS